LIKPVGEMGLNAATVGSMVALKQET